MYDQQEALPLTSGVGSNDRGWVQLARPTGGIVQNGSQKFEITDDDLEAFAESIRANDLRVSIDYDHSFGSGKGSRAAGWIDSSSVEVRPGARGGLELWAIVDWTPAAAKAIRDGEFRFISPELTFASSKDGVLRRAKAFLAAALTNRPFFKDMAPVALVRLAEEGSTMEDEDVALVGRTEAILLSQGVFPSRASYVQYADALVVAGHELGSRSVGPRETPVDPDSVVLAERIDALLAERSAEWGREPTTEDYLRVADEVVTGRRSW